MMDIAVDSAALKGRILPAGDVKRAQNRPICPHYCINGLCIKAFSGPWKSKKIAGIEICNTKAKGDGRFLPRPT
jgi:hypothetical protein